MKKIIAITTLVAATSASAFFGEIGRCRQDRFFGTGIISNERTGTG
jgi:hypothetical protein